MPWFGIAADRGRDEHAVAPDDRARDRDAGDRRLPRDVLAGRRVPLHGRRRAVGDARGVRAAEGGPVLRRERDACASSRSATSGRVRKRRIITFPPRACRRSDCPGRGEIEAGDLVPFNLEHDTTCHPYRCRETSSHPLATSVPRCAGGAAGLTDREPRRL